MYRGKYQRPDGAERHSGSGKRMLAVLLSVVLLLTLATVGTLAYLAGRDTPLVNIFKPSKVTGEVTEEFDGQYKRNVNVTNTGDTEAYIRVRLVTYRVNEHNEHIGGTASIPSFEPGENWILYGDCYYYTLPVQPGASPAVPLVDEIALQAYSDADGGRQVIEVVAEAIQSGPAEAVGEAWGVSIAEGSVVPYAS